MMIDAREIDVQLPLIHVVQSDDLYLQNHADILWFDVLGDLDYRPFQPIAAHYYEALHQFNEDQAQARQQRVQIPADQETGPKESKEEATKRLLFERATMCKDAAILYEAKPAAAVTIEVDPSTVWPGRTPLRLAGKQPKCFFAMLKAFLGVTLRGRPPEPEFVHEELTSNPAFARTCGFTLPDAGRGYRQRDVPSLRKLEQFDQIMTDNELWDQAAVGQVARNLEEDRIQPESTLVHDTTHYPAFSSMQMVELPDKDEPASATKSRRKTKKKQSKAEKKRRRKSHPKTTKSCLCKDRKTCPHPWVNADEGAGTVTKSTGMYWAHKASTLGLPSQEILLDAVALSDAASHDSRSLVPHLGRLFARHPELLQAAARVLDDGAADDTTLKEDLQRTWGVELLAPINSRRRQPIRDDLPRGIDHITATGTPVCRQGYPFDLIGTRRDTERFIFRAPQDENAVPVCPECPQRSQCYRGEMGARQVTIAFERLPWIDPHFPQLSRRFQKAMAKRTSIERLHKLMKYDYGDERLTKRGNAAFQARLDKTLLVMHLVIAHD